MSVDHLGRMARLPAERIAGKLPSEDRQLLNAKPHGPMLPGGVTALVYELLSVRPGIRYTLDRIARNIARAPRSVSWALFILRSRKLVESVIVDDGRRTLWFVPSRGAGSIATGVSFSSSPHSASESSAHDHPSRLFYNFGSNRYVYLPRHIEQAVGDQQQAIGATARTGLPPVTTYERAEAWLKAMLQHGPLPAPQLRQSTQGAGLSWRSIQRAARELGVRSRRQGFGKAAEWRLPTDSESVAPKPK